MLLYFILLIEVLTLRNIMRFKDTEKILQNLVIFNLNDIRKIDQGFHRSQLTDWRQRGFIQPVSGGVYALADLVVNENILFAAANKIYSPSYVSLESALAYYQIIPETVLGMTSITTRRTRELPSNWGQFSYRSLKSEYYFGYQVVDQQQERKFLIAKLEKAVLDYLYLNPNIETVEDFEGLRWNRAELADRLIREKLESYLFVFNKLALNKRTSVLLRYLDA